jgi:hypothetical protein
VAHGDRALQFLSCEAFLEPLVAVTGARNQVVFRGALLGATPAEVAALGHGMGP